MQAGLQSILLRISQRLRQLFRSKIYQTFHFIRYLIMINELLSRTSSKKIPFFFVNSCKTRKREAILTTRIAHLHNKNVNTNKTGKQERETTSAASTNRQRTDIAGPETACDLVGNHQTSGHPAVENCPNHAHRVYGQAPRHSHQCEPKTLASLSFCDIRLQNEPSIHFINRRHLNKKMITDLDENKKKKIQFLSSSFNMQTTLAVDKSNIWKPRELGGEVVEAMDRLCFSPSKISRWANNSEELSSRDETNSSGRIDLSKVSGRIQNLWR